MSRAAVVSHWAEYVLPQASVEAARSLLRALEVEATATPKDSRVAMGVRGRDLVVTVEARDARALRAATNSFLRLVAVAEDVAGAE
jgi:tRNA threonylcarbamoyladenosine modification (KEOPS) complex  Pcc1 subunit